MIKKIVKDQMFLSGKAMQATKEDQYIIQDLYDTLKAYENKCVGMAANMIGYQKAIIIIYDLEKKQPFVMINPKVVQTSGKYYETMEGCLSLEGERPTKRYPQIKVEYDNENWQKRIKTYKGFTAQIIQHELDHLEGIII